MNSKLIRALLLGCSFLMVPTVAIAQAQDSFNIEMDLPEGSEEFGSADFAMNTTVTEEQAAAGAAFAAIMSALCTGIPALLLGCVIGYFIGKSRSPKTSPPTE